MEYYIYEKLPFFCDILIQLIDDGTIMDLVLLLLSQPKTQSCVEIESQSVVPQVQMDQHDRSYDEIGTKGKYYYMKKKEIIEGLFNNLTLNKWSDEIQQKESADAQTLEEKQRRKSKKFQEQIYDPDIILWRMKNSSMIICEILDHFQDIKGGEELGFVILNYHSQQIFQSLSSNNVEEISFSCDVAQHLLAFLQNEDIQFQIEFEKIKGNLIVETYFKEAISSIKKELVIAQVNINQIFKSYKQVLFFQYEWNNQLHLNVMHLFETIIEVAQQNDNPSWIFYIIKRVNIVDYIISNSDQSFRRIINPTTKQPISIQKSYNGHLKKIAEALMKCLEKNFQYQAWIEDQSKWTELTELVTKQQTLLKGKLGEEEEAKKQKFQLNNCKGKQSLLNRRKQQLSSKKDQQADNNSASGNNTEVFKRLSSPIKKTITLQVGTPKQLKVGYSFKEIHKENDIHNYKNIQIQYQLNQSQCQPSRLVKFITNRENVQNLKFQYSPQFIEKFNSPNKRNNTNKINLKINKLFQGQKIIIKYNQQNFNIKLKRGVNEDEEDEQSESVSFLQSKKEYQQSQQQKQFSMDSPMLKSKNSTPLLSSNSSLTNQQINQQLGLRTPKTPILSTPTRTLSNTPQTPNMKKLMINSPLQKNHIRPENIVLNKDKFDLNTASKDNTLNRDTKESAVQKNQRKISNNYRSNGSSYEGDDLDSSQTSFSSIDSSMSRSSSLDRQYEERIKTREIHNQLLKDLDIQFGEDETKNFTYKHSIKIDGIGFQYINKKQKILFDWNQNAEDEEEQQKLLIRQEEEENNKKILSEQTVNENYNNLNLFNMDSAQVIQQRHNNTNNNKNKFDSQHQQYINQSKNVSPNTQTFNLNKQNENQKINDNEQYNSPKIHLKGSPYLFGYNQNKSYLSQNLDIKNHFKKKNFKQESPCIQVNKQYFGYLIKDTIRKYSYDHQLDQKSQPTTSQLSQVRNFPQNNTFKSQFNLEESTNEHLRKLIPIKHREKTRDGRLSFESISNRLSLNNSKENNQNEGIPQSMESLSYLRTSNQSSKVNSKLVKQVRDILDISDGSSHSLAWKSHNNFDDHRTPSKVILEKTIKENGGLSQSDISSEDEKEKLQQREKIFERKNVKKKSTFFQSQKYNATKTNCEHQKTELKIVEESLLANDQNESPTKITPYARKTIFIKQNSQEKALNQAIKARVKNLNIENESEKDSYGDLEDYSPTTKKSIKSLSKKNINSDKLIKTFSNKNISSSEEGADRKLICGSHLISSATSIQNKIENVKSEDSENKSILSKDDQIFINLISGDEDSKQSKNSTKQISIVKTIIQRNQEKKRSYFSQSLIEKPYYSLQSQCIKQKEIESNLEDTAQSNCQQKTRLGRKNSFSSNTLSISKQNNQLSQSNLPIINSENSLQNSQKIQNNDQPSLDKIPPFYYTNHIESNANEKDQDLILKILLRQDNSTSANSEILRSLDDKSQSEISQKDISQENVSCSQSEVINEQIS